MSEQQDRVRASSSDAPGTDTGRDAGAGASPEMETGDKSAPAQQRQRRSLRYVPWYRKPRGLAAMVVVALVVGAIVYMVVNRDDDPSYQVGPQGDPRATDPTGTAAWVSLLEAAGKDVHFIDSHGGKTSFDDNDAFVVLNPLYLTDGDQDVARAAAQANIPIVFGTNSEATSTVMAALGGWRTRDVPSSPTAVRVGAHESIPSEITTLAIDSGGVFLTPPMASRFEDLVLLGSQREQFGVRYEFLGGSFWMLGNTTMLENALLGEEDNAAFALSVVGDAHDVYFLTAAYRTGGTSDTAVDARPDFGWSLFSSLSSQLKAFLLLLIASFLAYLWSKSVRLGPLDGGPPVLAPKRSEYVDAMARHFDRPGRLDGVLRPLAARAVTLLNQRGAALPSDAGTDHILAVATRLGVAPNGSSRSDVVDHDGAATHTAPASDEALPPDLAQLAALVARLERGEATVTETDPDRADMLGGSHDRTM